MTTRVSTTQIETRVVRSAARRRPEDYDICACMHAHVWWMCLFNDVCVKANNYAVHMGWHKYTHAQALMRFALCVLFYVSAGAANVLLRLLLLLLILLLVIVPVLGRRWRRN